MNELIVFILSVILGTVLTVICTVALILGAFLIWDKTTTLIEKIC